MIINTTTKTNYILKHERRLVYIQFYAGMLFNILFSILLNNSSYNLSLILSMSLFTCAIANHKIFNQQILKWIFILLTLIALSITYYYFYNDYLEITIIMIIYCIAISLTISQKVILFSHNTFTLKELTSVLLGLQDIFLPILVLISFNISLNIFGDKKNYELSITQDKFSANTSTELLIDFGIILLKIILIIFVTYIIISLIELLELTTDSSYMINENPVNHRYETYICNKHKKCLCSINFETTYHYKDTGVNNIQTLLRHNHHHEMVKNTFNLSFANLKGLQYLLQCLKLVKCLFGPFLIPVIIGIIITSYTLINIDDMFISIIAIVLFILISTLTNVIFYNKVFSTIDNSVNYTEHKYTGITCIDRHKYEDEIIVPKKIYTNTGISCICTLIGINHSIIYSLPIQLIALIIIAICVTVYKNYFKEHVYELQNYINKTFCDLLYLKELSDNQPIK